jgi:hypothetical protein
MQITNLRRAASEDQSGIDARCPTSDGADPTVPSLRSFAEAGRVRRTRLWVPSTRQLWCYALILDAAPNRPPRS